MPKWPLEFYTSHQKLEATVCAIRSQNEQFDSAGRSHTLRGETEEVRPSPGEFGVKFVLISVR